MKSPKPLLFFLVLCLTFAMGGLTSQAQEPGRHPAYIHALSDLRLMRAYLDRLTPNDRVDDEAARAIGEIDEAIRIIKEASIDDHKDLRDHPPVDTRIKPEDRYRKALEAGRAAQHDVNEEEDNQYARGLKHRALERIENANRIVEHIIHRYEH